MQIIYISGTAKACLQEDKVSLVRARVTLVRGLKLARVYKQNFTGRVTLSPVSTLQVLYERRS